MKFKTLKTAYPLVVLGSISVFNWISYARAFEHEGIPLIGVQSAFAFIAPISAFLGVAAIYAHFHGKSGKDMAFKEAVFHVSLASTPLSINGMLLLAWIYHTQNWVAYVLNPFAGFLIAGVTIYEALGPGAIAPGNTYAHVLTGFLVNYGAAWLAFFVIYSRLSRVGKMRARMVFTSLIFISILALVGHYLVVVGVSLALLFIYKIKNPRTKTRSRILDFLAGNQEVHFRGLAKALNINRGTLDYHLKVLERLRLIKSLRIGRFKVFYVNSRADGAYLTGTAKDIFEYVRDHPESTEGKIAEELHISPSTVSYHLKNLKDMGLLHVHRKGREIRVRREEK